MPITDRQRELRKKYIGSSDAPAIMGLDPFRSAAEVWAEKVLDLEPQPETPAMKMGNVMEAVLVKYAADELGVKVKRNQSRVAGDGISAANLDGLVVGKPWAIEAKRVGRNSPHLAAYDPDINAVPDALLIQAHHQMYVANLSLVYVPVLLVDTLEMFHIERNDTLCQAVAQRNADFWRKYVESKTRPDNVPPPPFDVLKRVRRTPKKVAEISAETLARLREASEKAKLADAELSEAKAEVLLTIGDADAAIVAGSDAPAVTYFEQTRQGFDTKAFVEEYPLLWEQFQKESKFRVFRIKKGA